MTAMLETAGNSVRRATYDRQACIRCGKPIYKGDPIESIQLEGASWKSWVHKGCTVPPRNGQEASDAVHVDDVVDQVCGKVLAKLGGSPGVGGGVGGNGDGVDIDGITGRLSSQLDEIKVEIGAAVSSKVRDTADRLATYVDSRISELTVAQVIEVRSPDREPKKLEGIFHACLPTVLKLAAMRKNVFLVGPAGGGKSTLAKHVADALDLDFGFISFSEGVSESKLVGKCTPNVQTGEQCYTATRFVDVYENGGVFLFDEMDAADPNVLLIINSALANGKLALDRPGKPVAEKHADFVCIAGVNTVGRGADLEYSGRNRLDEATLDRFRVGMVAVDYDPKLEEMVCPDKQLRQTLQGWRKKITENRMKRVLSTRFLAEAYDMTTNGGFTLADIEKSYFLGWNNDDRKKVLGR